MIFSTALPIVFGFKIFYQKPGSQVKGSLGFYIDTWQIYGVDI
jgi:hypothetical protein